MRVKDTFYDGEIYQIQNGETKWYADNFWKITDTFRDKFHSQKKNKSADTFSKKIESYIDYFSKTFWRHILWHTHFLLIIKYLQTLS